MHMIAFCAIEGKSATTHLTSKMHLGSEASHIRHHYIVRIIVITGCSSTAVTPAALVRTTILQIQGLGARRKYVVMGKRAGPKIMGVFWAKFAVVAVPNAGCMLDFGSALAGDLLLTYWQSIK